MFERYDRTRDARQTEVMEYLKDKLILAAETENCRPLTDGQVTIWRLDWVVLPFWEQVLAVELGIMAKDWGVRLSWSTSNVQQNTGRCLVSIAFYWDMPYRESTAMDKI